MAKQLISSLWRPPKGARGIEPGWQRRPIPTRAAAPAGSRTPPDRASAAPVESRSRSRSDAGTAMRKTPPASDSATPAGPLVEAPPRRPRPRPPSGCAAPPLDGERKQVTVLFADVKGSMDLAEQTDPEEWRQIMQRFFALLSEGVRRFEGTVDKFTGDGIMALFGAPIAHEDHAPRACFAALHIGELVAEYAGSCAAPRASASRSGSGSTRARWSPAAIGEDDELAYTAVGHTVGPRAAHGGAGGARQGVPDRARREARRGLPGAEGPRRVRGQGGQPPDQASSSWSARARRASRLDLSRERGLSRFVGRAEEMEVLEEALAAGQEGEGR